MRGPGLTGRGGSLRKVVGVMGSGQEPYPDLAAEVGRLIAQRGWHLLTGGGAGVMASVSEAFVRTPERAGLCLGVLKGTVESGRYECLGGPNPFVELAVRTHLPDSGERGTELTSRNHVNVLSADAVVVLPGGPGTASELALALRYGRPVVVYGRPGQRVGSEVLRGERLAAGDVGVRVASSLGALAEFLDAQLAQP